ncbi:MarR family winged helix-turn-helix transcriptional regulator [Williamsia sp. CHRR-6]|uniref:MarR family winged helix-turn-helix transcriptional regulator n=1 Tax=Williamsia sp. CHRR-6 TaxID=2835871 RepID=UPI001BD972E1|nr:MarR family transcriptional regulator [Williamsia sp. CHRR-6]MBT0567270.1 MarR family transcriptional regulator [Williamsia sp. CHRR-6]
MTEVTALPFFDHAEQSASLAYTSIARILRALRSQAGAPTLSMGSTSALWTLVNQHPMRMSELAQREGVAVPTMSRIVAILERNALVVREADPNDRRASLLTPTDEGIDLVNGTTSARVKLMEEALAQLDPADRAAAERSLVLLAEVITKDARSPRLPP